MVKPHVCIDCLALPLTARPPRPRPTDGRPRAPRCYTHGLEEIRRVKAANQARNWRNTFGLTADDYAKLYEFQGGKCAICRVATGEARALAVDHDHSCCPGPSSCGNCTRGLLCKGCNFVLLGRYGNEALLRAVAYIGGDNPATRLRSTGRWPVR